MTFESVRGDAPATEAETEAPPSPYAGFFRRAVAFALDYLFVGLLLFLPGLLAFDLLTALGPWGRLIGFAVFVAYFAVFEGPAGKGRTPGKRLAGIRVVGLDGTLLPPGRAGLRAAVVGLPLLLNNFQLPPGMASPWLMFGLGVIVFGGFVAIVYLMIFNRPSRRSVQDLLTGSQVLRADTDEIPRPHPVARVHGIVLSVLECGLLGLLVVLGQTMTDLPEFRLMRRAQLAVAEETGAWGVLVRSETGFRAVSGSDETSETQGVAVSVLTQDPLSPGSGPTPEEGQSTAFTEYHAGIVRYEHEAGSAAPDPLAGRIATLLLERYPELAERDHFTVKLNRGFDFGPASLFEKRVYSLPPAVWRDMLGLSPAP